MKNFSLVSKKYVLDSISGRMLAYSYYCYFIFSHTLKELERMEMVRNHLIDNGVTDWDGLIDFVNHS